MQGDTDTLLVDAYRYRFIRRLAMSDTDTQDHIALVMELAVPGISGADFIPTEDQFDAAVDAGMEAL